MASPREPGQAPAQATSEADAVLLDQTVGQRVHAPLGAAAGRLAPVRDVETTLCSIVAGMIDTVPGAEQAGVTEVARDGTISCRVPTDGVVGELDRLQSELAEGPCLEALQTEDTVMVYNFADETERWPGFAARAVELGMASLLSFRLSAATAPYIALNLYASHANAFDEAGMLLGELFASHAALSLAHARQVNDLTHALGTRDVIGQAKGRLMERFGISAVDAFNMLVEASQDANLKLVAVARWLTTENHTNQLAPDNS